MILLGFQLLNIFPFLRKFQPKMPKFIGHRIHEAGEGNAKGGPLFLGAATFFLPCGFTQALQLYVLSRGGFALGATTMLVFALGTLPALLSLGAITSFAKGAFQSYFMKFAGVVVILLGIGNISNGLTLTGVSAAVLSAFQSSNTAQTAALAANAVPIVNGQQVVKMAVAGLSYSPSNITITKGVPVSWQIDGTGAVGCAQVINVPSLNITQYLSGVQTISFTPAQTGEIDFNCPMGMARGSFTVVDGKGQTSTSTVGTTTTVQPTNIVALNQNNPSVNTLADANAQKLSMTIDPQTGFYPNQFSVKVGAPVELDIDAKIVPGGCMSTMVMPDYGIAHLITLGKNVIQFTPNKTGVTQIACSMGTPIAQINVTS